MSEQMNSLERIRAAINFIEADRVPIFPLAHYSTTRVVNMKISEFASNPDSMARALLASYKYFGYDGICPGVDVVVEAEAMGSKTYQPDDGPASVVKPVIQKYEDLYKLKTPNPLKDGRMPVIIKATEIIHKEVGNEACIGSWIIGPMNLASQLRGVEQLMFDIVDSPDFFEELLDFATEVGIIFGKALVDAGSNMISMGEALASPSFINPITYRKFILERQRRVHNELTKYGSETTIIHICGNIKPILYDIASIGAVIDVDWPVDMAEAKKTGVPIRGNIDPSSILLSGSPDQIEEKVRYIMDTSKAGGGLILGSGCDVSPNTPFKNIEAFVQAGIKYGQY